MNHPRDSSLTAHCILIMSSVQEESDGFQSQSSRSSMEPADFSSVLPAIETGASDLLPIPFSTSDPRIPLFNLSILRHKMDSLRRSLSDSIHSHSSAIDADRIGLASAEISAAIHHIILNGAALIASGHHPPNLHDEKPMISPNELDPDYVAGKFGQLEDRGSTTVKSVNPGTSISYSPERLKIHAKTRQDDIAKKISPKSHIAGKSGEFEDERSPCFIVENPGDPLSHPASLTNRTDLIATTKASKTRNKGAGGSKEKEIVYENDADCEIVELDAVELLAEHVHFCDICGKGFKRDANLRMHMRAHGNQFKTLEALAKPEVSGNPVIKTRFSCPFPGCNRNRAHKKFRPLKSVVCVKTHFRRSHCPKMYSCDRCNKKSFSVVADLKSHLKQCGECKWRCSCGTTFTRKDKLFGHLALFEGHMPAILGEEKSVEVVSEEIQMDEVEPADYGFFEGLLDGFDLIDGGSLDDVFEFANMGAAEEEIGKV